jgi:hypothetical protein
MNIALLAPVPFEHLQSGLTVCNTKGKVAFGSMAWEVFRELDKVRDGQPVTVYLYASDDPDLDMIQVSWIGRYTGHVESKAGAHPKDMEFRPPSTEKYPNDNKGHWAVFWELDGLRKLHPSDRIFTSDFTGYKTSKHYKDNFVPKGPLLVYPKTLVYGV